MAIGEVKDSRGPRVPRRMRAILNRGFLENAPSYVCGADAEAAKSKLGGRPSNTLAATIPNVLYSTESTVHYVDTVK